jgi:hypothetical protein
MASCSIESAQRSQRKNKARFNSRLDPLHKRAFKSSILMKLQVSAHIINAMELAYQCRQKEEKVQREIGH